MKFDYEIVIDSVAVLLGDYSNEVKVFDRNDPRVRAWKKAVLAKGKCELCGSTENLEAHHIIYWSEYPDGRIDLNNGMCLCHACHTEEHKFDPSYHMMKSKISGGSDG